jgi:hypothetical protein
LLCLLASATTSAEASPSSSLPVPGSFRLEGTNGYKLYVVAEPGQKGGPDSVLIVASGEDGFVTYRAPATLTETSIQADLGELGTISVNFQRTDRPAVARCEKRPVRFDSGSYVGTVSFHGEEGYTDAEATTVPGNLEYELGLICGGVSYGSSSSGPRPGAALSVRNPALGPELGLSKHRPGAAAEIFARLKEFENGIAIERTIGRRIPGRDFEYDPSLHTAIVRPPAPFAGSARFDLGEKPGRRWSGDLSADFPGRSDVALTGPLLRATLSPSE